MKTLCIIIVALAAVCLLFWGCGKSGASEDDLLAFAKEQVSAEPKMEANLGDTDATLGDVDASTLVLSDSKNVKMEEGTYRWGRVDGKTKDGRPVMLNVEYQPKEKTLKITNLRVDKKPK